MRIVFMGTPTFAVPTLKALIESRYSIIGAVTQPDKPKGRGKTVMPPPVKELAQSWGIPVLQPDKMKEPDFLDTLRRWNPDFIVVTAFGRILPKVILDLPLKGCVNVHASLLPRYRGAAPIQWAIMKGETQTGVTTMMMDEGMDTGDILLQESLEIFPEETAGELAARLAEVGGALLVTTLQGLEAGSIVPQPQSHQDASLAPLLKKEAGNVDWTLGARDIVNRIRGLSPWPGCYSYLRGERLVIWKALEIPNDFEDHLRDAAGTIVSVNKSECVVRTGEGLVAIRELQPANKKRMTIEEFVRGRPLSRCMQFQMSK